MQGQDAGRTVEQPLRCDVDQAMMQLNASQQGSQRQPREIKHLGRGIDTVEVPARLRLGEDLDLEPAAGAEDQNARIVELGLGPDTCSYSPTLTGC